MTVTRPEETAASDSSRSLEVVSESAAREKLQSMSFAQELWELLQRRLIQMLVLTCLLTAVAARAMLLKSSVLDLDIWWHLKVGDWIIEHHAFPHTGILSRKAAQPPR